MTDNLNVGRIESGGGAVVLGNVRVKGGTFIGRDQVNNYYNQYVTQVFPARAVALPRSKYPFVGDRPFRAEENSIFAGRAGKINSFISQFDLPDNLTTVVYGPAGVGKTSFISAGVLPRLNGDGTEVIALRDYRHASPLLRALLQGRAAQLGAVRKEDTPSPDLVQAILEATSRRLVLVLDQLERLFLEGISEIERESVQEELRGILGAADPRRLRIIITIRDDQQSELDREWGDLLPGLRESPVHLQPFSLPDAKKAIMEPVGEVGVQPGFQDKFVEKQLLDDLDKLSARNQMTILPADLQIVCHRLYENAQGLNAQVIDEDLYYKISNSAGAEWLLDQHFKGLWATIEGSRRALAEEIVKQMLAKGLMAWVEAGKLVIEGKTRQEIEATLEEMVRSGLLVRHIAAEDPAYTFASYSTARSAKRSMGRGSQKQLQAQDEVEYAWQDWMAENRLAGTYQLHLIEDHYSNGPLAPQEALLLLRSAVESEIPVEHWLAQLQKTEATQSSIQELEKVQEQLSEGIGHLTGRWNQAHILGLDDIDLPKRPSKFKYGPVSWVSANHLDIGCRETSVLALKSAHPDDVLKRVDAAVGEGKLNHRQNAARENQSRRWRLPIPEGWKKRWRLAELRGILANADDGLEGELRGKGWRERLETWWWRFRRRLRRDRDYIWRIALGGGIGAGLGLALLRALLAPLLEEDAGFFFYSYFPTGFLLGFALALGLIMVNVISLKPPEHRSGSKGSRSFLRALVLGSLFFAGGQVLLIALLRPLGFIEAPLIPPLALVAGAGLSLVVYDQPMVGWQISAGRFLLRLVILAMVFVLIQTAFVLVDLRLGPNDDLGVGLTFAWSGYFFETGLHDNLLRWGFEKVLIIDYWFHLAAIIDSALTGLALAFGLTLGMIRADNRYHKWLSLVRRAGD